jgi:hypothetical protein
VAPRWQGWCRLRNPAVLHPRFGPSYDALRLSDRVAASPGYRGVGTPAAIGQLESHAVCRAAFAAPCLMGQGFVWPGLPAQLGVMCSPSQRWAAWLLRCYRPHRGGRLFCLTRCALPRRRHLAAPSHTPFTHFGDWRRFPAPRAVEHCVRLLLCSMWEGDVLDGPGREPGKVLCGLHVFQLLTYLSRQQVTGMAFLNACTHGPYWSLCGASPASTSIYSPCAALLSAPPPNTSPSVVKEPFRGDRRSVHPTP